MLLVHMIDSEHPQAMQKDHQPSIFLFLDPSPKSISTHFSTFKRQAFGSFFHPKYPFDVQVEKSSPLEFKMFTGFAGRSASSTNEPEKHPTPEVGAYRNMKHVYLSYIGAKKTRVGRQYI